MSTTAEIQAYVRANTATAYSYEGDLHALCDLAGVPAGHLLERLGALLETLPQGVLALLQNGSVEELLPILAPFSPASLFANGAQGVWYDPSDLSTLYQDAAGTTPVTGVEQPVGRMLDKSGRGNHATQATTTSRPTLQQDTSGKYYLSFDGVDDYLSTGSIDFTGTDKMTVLAGVRKFNPLGKFSNLVRLGTSTQSTNGFYIAAPSGIGQYTFMSSGSAQAFAFSENTQYSAPNTAIVSAVSDIAAPSILLRINGGKEVLSNNNSQGSGKYSNNPIYIGNAGANTFNGQLYGLVIRGALSDANQIANAERFMNSKTGAY